MRQTLDTELQDVYDATIQQDPPHQTAQAIANANPHVLRALRAYTLVGDRDGGFVTACLWNDFALTVQRADHGILLALDAVALYLTNYVPLTAWGDGDAVIQWSESGGLLGNEVLDLRDDHILRICSRL